MQPPNTSKLDKFLADILKTPDNTAGAEWSEVEVLLKPESKSIPVQINKKQVFIFASIIIIAGAGAFGIFKAVQYYKSLPEETVVPTDTAQAVLMAADTVKIISKDTIALAVDTSRADSLEQTERKTDSLLAVSDSLLKKEKAKQAADAKAAQIQKQQEKKQKQSKTKTGIVPVDSSAVTMPVETIPPPPDTAGKKSPEIKPSAADTAKSSAASSKKGSKKSKKSKSISADSSKTSPAKPDSLK